MSYDLEYHLESIWRYSFFSSTCNFALFPSSWETKESSFCYQTLSVYPDFIKLPGNISKNISTSKQGWATQHISRSSPQWACLGQVWQPAPKSRQTGKLGNRWSREKGRGKSVKLVSSANWIFSKPKEVFYWKDCSLQQASELSGALKPPRVRGSRSTTSPLGNNGVGRILLMCSVQNNLLAVTKDSCRSSYQGADISPVCTFLDMPLGVLLRASTSGADAGPICRPPLHQFFPFPRKTRVLIFISFQTVSVVSFFLLDLNILF